MNRICVRMPNWVGDVVMATPLLRALKENLHDIHVTIVIDSTLVPVIRRNEFVDKIIPYDRRSDGWESVKNFGRCVGEIKANDCDVAVILPHSFSSALMMWFARVDSRIGYKRDARKMLLTTAIERPTDENGVFQPFYMAKYYLDLLEPLDIESGDTHPYLNYSGADGFSAEKILSGRGIKPDSPLFLIHPSAGYGPSKLWPLKHYKELIEMLAEKFAADIAFIGAPSANVLVKKLQNLVTVPTFNLTSCGLDLHLLKYAVDRAELLISTDSGPRHYGVALNTPTVCLMGPTAPAYTESGFPHDYVARVDVDCGPCQKKICTKDHRCMTQLTPKTVYKVCEKALSRDYRE